MKSKKPSNSALKPPVSIAGQPKKKKPPVIAGTTKMDPHPSLKTKP